MPRKRRTRMSRPKKTYPLVSSDAPGAACCSPTVWMFAVVGEGCGAVTEGVNVACGVEVGAAWVAVSVGSGRSMVNVGEGADVAVCVDDATMGADVADGSGVLVGAGVADGKGVSVGAGVADGRGVSVDAGAAVAGRGEGVHAGKVAAGGALQICSRLKTGGWVPACDVPGPQAQLSMSPGLTIKPLAS